ncbi:hypothetical protein OEZ85_003878 [Tetradesmus obliquus]|uniref:AB hydrolase-1 domain-containing protein n=1 Tax=Tetradesmus obliquus TaxID=3088 RepID=A0ABY8UCP7_TETOB|nr:hypothetical protein OEZ85_003878 [Tetradesmus obliquus]
MRRVPSVSRLEGSTAGRPAYPGARLVRRARDKAVAWSSYVQRSSVVATAASPVKLGSTVVRSLSRHSLRVLNAVAMANAAALPSDADLSVDLDWRPSLSATQEIVCWSCAAITACVVYLFTAPAGVSIPYATCIGLLFGLVLYTLRNALLEELYKARERIEADLGDPDSRFRHIDNLSVHVKVKASRSLPPPAPTAAAARLAPPPAAAARLQGPVPAVHCYHGFGSNTWSWSLVQQQLAERLGALVTAHDMPGFGLTQRPTDLSGYYLAFNGRLGRLVMDYELTTAVMLSTVLVLSLLRPAIVLLLRSLVRSRTFWANTLRQAYYDQSKVTAAAVDAYRLPQLVKGWESGMVQFLLARLGAGGSTTATSAAAAAGAAPMGGLEDAGLATRFAAAVAAHNTPVLIVHGAGDKLVPASNSMKLARLVKGCRLAVVKRAGHCPQEEEPELFADIVTSFLARHTAVQGA